MPDDHPATLLDMPHDRARAALETGAPAFLFINPVEYHGPHLPLHNDHLVSLGLARDLHRRWTAQHPDWPFLSAGDLEIGVAPTRGRGSRHTSFPVACALVREACRALVELGARKVVLMTFHGAPLHNLAIEEGVNMLENEGIRAVAPFNAAMRFLLDVDPELFAEAFAAIADEAERAATMRELFLDFHAGFFETSMTLHYAPASVSPAHRNLPPCPRVEPIAPFARAARLAAAMGRAELSRELSLVAWGMGWQQLDPFPGYTGRPHLASGAAGAVIARRMIDHYAELCDEVFAGRARSPAPILRWTAAATLHGRILT